eukprot:6683072-Pyramimonas_sp.AAC.1
MVPRRPKRPPRRLPRGPQEAQIIDFLSVVENFALKTIQEDPQDRPKTAPEAPKKAPRQPKRAPRQPKRRPRRPKRPQRRLQEGAQM